MQKTWWLVIVISLQLLMGCTPNEASVAYGTLERDQVRLLATRSEIIIEVMAQKGQHVEQGQPLLRLDSTELGLKVAQAKQELVRAESWLQELENGARTEQVAAAQARLDQLTAERELAKAQLVRQQQLMERQLTSKADLDVAQELYAAASAATENASQQLLELQHGNRPEAIAQAKASVEAQTLVVAQAEKAVADLTIIATRSGILEDLPYHLGERIPQGSVAALIAVNDAPYARVYIPQPYLASITVGQQVQVQADGLEGMLTGTIRKISSEASFTPYYALQQSERARLVYVTEITLADAANLPSGMPVQMVLP
ncbi:HlyD family secretion protein [Alteromonas facilis]|uniref:HlyD family secretion protein n=1 Tax=Alteromonas facilis TaxID=2048004 RepID=UPI000C28A8D5|nr:HlyD family efflux transporter periplasmic adaptor subunit [Alteromonas facilis]